VIDSAASAARTPSDEVARRDGARLFEELYEELRHLAAGYMRHQSSAHTLQTTALIGEAYLKLAQTDDSKWIDRGHFMGVAARAMRSVLVDHARTKGRDKRHGGRKRISLDGLVSSLEERSASIVDLDDALNELEQSGAQGARCVRVVELRFFSGLEMTEIADILDLELRTAHRDWAFARAWLGKRLR